MDDLEVLLALRAHLTNVVVATTGLVTLTATATGFTRSAGSFVADGFYRGMEVVPFGFTDNTPAVIQSMTASTVTIIGSRPAEAAGAGRSLTVGIPAQRGWENTSIAFLDNRWFIDEDYLPGIPFKETIGKRGMITYGPQYILKIYGIAGYGVTAMYTVSKAILDAFMPHTEVATMGDGYVLRVGSEPGPYRGQALPVQDDPGHTVVVITIPLLKRIQNQA